MIVPERLLKMLPLDALVAQLDDNLVPPLRGSHLRIGEPVAVDRLRTAITAQVVRDRAIVDMWGKVGEVDFEFTRLDLGVFGETLPRIVKPEFPVTARQLLQTVLSPYGIPVADDDVVEAVYTGVGLVTIYASDKSYRWVGELLIEIQRQELDIAKLITVSWFTPSFTAAWNSNSVKQTLTSYLNALNNNTLPRVITNAMYTLSTPAENGSFDAGDNTKISLTFSGNPYSGRFDVTYMRRSFQDTYRRPVELSGNNPGNTRALSSMISAQMGCLIAPADIFQETIPPMRVGESRLIKVSFAPESLAYVGEVMIQYSRTT